MSKFTLPVVLLLITVWVACTDQSTQESPVEAKAISVDTDPFHEYWYQGEAEITTFELEQARYGQIRQGHATQVFVTEPFSKSKQVKLDYPQKVESDKVSVLKLNFTRKFTTGLYPYSIMQSTFSPVAIDQYPHALKSNATIQEWCGQVFTQLNLANNNRYEYKGFSYFESEGDVEGKLATDWLEDELWNYIRIHPEKLPQGLQKIVPSLVWLRLQHQPIAPYEAELVLEQQKNTYQYTVQYKNLDRSLSIQFRNTFPYDILSWEEESAGQITRARRLKQLKTDYWNHNRLRDSSLRARLGLQ